MSQAGILNVSGALPPDVPITFQTDNGNATPAANTIIFTAEDSSENNNEGVTFEGSGNTVTLLLTNRLQGIGSANDGATVDLVTFNAGGTAGVYTIDLKVSLFDSSTPAGAGYHVRGAVRTTGAAASVIDDPDEFVNEEAALAMCDVDLLADGNNIIIRGTGTAGLTVNFSAVAEYVFAPGA